MWVLEADQCAAIRKAAFALRCEQALGFLHDGDTVAQPLLPAIQLLLGRAIDAGLFAERAAFQFIRAAWIFGDSFDSKIPPIVALFASTELDSAAKADRLARAIELTLAALAQAKPPAPATAAANADARASASATWGSAFLRAYESANPAEREAARAALLVACTGVASDQVAAPAAADANLTAIVNALSAIVRVDQPSLG